MHDAEDIDARLLHNVEHEVVALDELPDVGIVGARRDASDLGELRQLLRPRDEAIGLAMGVDR